MVVRSRMMRFICGAAALFTVLAVTRSAVCAPENKPSVSIAYFYINACGSCDKEQESKLDVYHLIGSLKDDADIDIKLYNTFFTDGALMMKKYCDAYQVPESKRMVPMLFINGIYLSGEEEIRGHLKEEFQKTVQSPAKPGGPNSLPTENGDAADTGKEYQAVKNNTSDTVLIYFYVPSCGECEKAAQGMKALKSRYTITVSGTQVDSPVSIKNYNAGEAANMALLHNYFDCYQVPEKEQKVPIVFTGGAWFSGAEAISTELLQAVSAGKGIGTIEVKIQNARQDTSDLSGYSILGVLGAGLVNGLNPCSLSIVLFFLSLLAVKNVNLLKAGIAFISGKFIMFFLLGTLLYRLFLAADIQWFQTVTKGIVVALAVAFFVLNIHDMLSVKKELYGKVRLQLPEGLRRLNHRIIKSLSAINNERVFLPLSFLIGMVIAAGEFLCTGQIYLATIVLVLQNNPVFDLKAILYFTLYGVAFVLPLLLLTVLVHKGKAVFELSEAIRAKMPLIKLINAVLFLVFSVIVVLI